MRSLRHIGVLAAVIGLGLPSAARGEDRPLTERESLGPSLRSSVARHLATAPAVSSDQRRVARRATRSHQATNQPGFIARHPVVSGLLIGMAAGTAAAAAAWGSEGAFVGFYSGAAAGATLGWALSR